jgi:phospholipid transport system transporter-binding protein
MKENERRTMQKKLEITQINGGVNAKAGAVAASIDVQTSGSFLVRGELNFSDAPKLELLGCKLIHDSFMPVFDLAAVTSSDNAGLALLVAWVRCAKKLNKAVKFLNIPKQLLALINASGLQTVLVDKQLKYRER